MIKKGVTIATKEHWRCQAFARCVATTDSLGNTICRAYGAVGNVTAEWGAVYPVEMDYDSHNRRVALHTTRDGTAWRDALDVRRGDGRLHVEDLRLLAPLRIRRRRERGIHFQRPCRRRVRLHARPPRRRAHADAVQRRGVCARPCARRLPPFARDGHFEHCPRGRPSR